MSKKHYIRVAAMIKRRLCADNASDFRSLAVELGDFFKSDNPNFNYDRFMQACGFDF